MTHERRSPLITPAYHAPPEVVEEIPNIDHRFGDGRAEILGIAVFDESGSKLTSLQPNSTIVVRISVRAKANLDRPIVGFMFRNHLGVDFAGTNTAREGYHLPPLLTGEICTVDFYIDLPAPLRFALFLFARHRRRNAGALLDLRLDR